MAVINQVGNALTGSTGSGAFVGATSPTITQPLINNVIDGYTTTATAAGTTTLTVSSNRQQYFTGATTQTVVMPVASTLTLGQSWEITNNSTGIVTIQSSGANTIVALQPGWVGIITCILTSGTTAASWNFGLNQGVGTVQSFTPAIAFGGGTTGITYSQQVGFWSQVGKIVTVAVQITLTNKGSSTGSATLTGMPVTSKSGVSQLFGVTLETVTYATSPLGMSLPTASTTLTLFRLQSAGAVQILTDAAFANTSSLSQTFSYLAN